ncbi:hypothetical protein [Xanthomonas campestris]|uniref:hypothetical protein n=1 Tax=Xanthomonas campestris TaxID=339 RepID=UPI0023781600|nr:hypothetical protein [Xanthomonas campestris]MEA9733979.1 hypothetical protein [Xanthomonas campestris pv. raphani]WDJ75410.1 hypothetical protein JH282_13180 [Xanthomonas campestris pv. campestris]
MKARFPLAGLAFALSLSGCGGPPSNDDAEKALANLLTQSGAGQITSIQDFQLTGCMEAKDMEGYRCDTTGKVTIDIGGQQVPVPVSKNLRYAKESGTWKAYAK